MIKIYKQRFRVTNKSRPMYEIPGVNPESVSELFVNIEKYLKLIPEEEHWNLHYSICELIPSEKKRTFQRQNIIPFDIDGIDLEKIDQYHQLVHDAIGIQMGEAGIVCSGRGLHYLIALNSYWDEVEYFDLARKYYRVVAARITRALKNANLPGTVDTNVWAPAHTLRLPLTKNIKNPQTGYPKLDFIGDCTLISRIIPPLSTSLETLAGGEEEEVGDTLTARTTFTGGFYTPDTKGIIAECGFIKWTSENQASANEPQWNAMIGVVAHLENGRDLCHKFSEEHPGYSITATENKIDSALSKSGPRTCKNIATLWDGCGNCKWKNKIKSPISIKTASHIATKSTGFRQIKLDKLGNPCPGPIAFEDLRLYFEQLQPYITTESGICYVYDNAYWRYLSDVRLNEFAQMHVVPAPNSNECREFRSLIQRTNVRSDEWFTSTTEKKINIANGILDLSSGTAKLHQHSVNYGFRYRLDYEYNPDAASPRFDAFMKEISVDRQELEDILLEFAGYAFFSDDPVHAKALILLGEGANGKSTFLNILKYLAGEKAYSAVSLKDLSNDQMRHMLIGKLFNVTEETPNRAFVDSSIFKDLVTGGTVSAKLVYKEPIQFANRAKIILACNDLPTSFDTSMGFLRRLLIVPFDATFNRAGRDIHLGRKLQQEASGILNRIIEGYMRLQSQGYFTSAEASDSELQTYRENIDPFLQFTNDKLVVSADLDTHVTVSAVFEYYIDYAKKINQPTQMTRNMFHRRLKKAVPQPDIRFVRAGKFKEYVIKGVELKETYLGNHRAEF